MLKVNTGTPKISIVVIVIVVVVVVAVNPGFKDKLRRIITTITPSIHLDESSTSKY